MPTPYTGPTPPSPWDAERTTLLHKMRNGLPRIEWDVAFARVATLENKILGYHRGREDAKAEDAPLLEALQLLLRWAPDSGGSFAGNGGSEDFTKHRQAADKARAAIAQAQGKE